jgi:uncharacterized membrane protein
MMSHRGFIHSQLANNIDELKQLIKSNNNSEAFNLFEGGMDIKINRMNTMFNDLVWEYPIKVINPSLIIYRLTYIQTKIFSFNIKR